MKTIGLIGGMSWESSADYYRLINEEVQRELGGLHSAKSIMMSVDFHEIELLQAAGDWHAAGQILAAVAQALERAGADFVVLCTNTMHKVADDISAVVSIPLLHIADATGSKIKEEGLKKVGLLGTTFTMEQAFYKRRLEQQFGLHVLVPSDRDRKIVHTVIYEELCKGQILEESRREFKRIIDLLGKNGADGIVLGCTEIGLLLQQKHSNLPIFDTTKIHAKAAVRLALADDGGVVQNA